MGFLSEEKVFIEVEFPQMQENEEIKLVTLKCIQLLRENTHNTIDFPLKHGNI